MINIDINFMQLKWHLCLYLCPSIHSSIHLFVRPYHFICPSVRLSVSLILFIHPSVHPSVSIILFIHSSVSIILFIHPSVRILLFIQPSIHPSVHQYHFIYPSFSTSIRLSISKTPLLPFQKPRTLCPEQFLMSIPVKKRFKLAIVLSFCPFSREVGLSTSGKGS